MICKYQKIIIKVNFLYEFETAWHFFINTVEPRNSDLQFSGKPRNSKQFSNDQLFIK